MTILHRIDVVVGSIAFGRSYLSLFTDTFNQLLSLLQTMGELGIGIVNTRLFQRDFRSMEA
jgi:hypothetical protein